MALGPRMGDAKAQPLLAALVGEAVASLRDSNRKVHRAAAEVLVGLGEHCLAAPDAEAAVNALLVLVASGLRHADPIMQAAAVQALGVLFYSFKQRLPQRPVMELFATVLQLMSNPKHQLIMKSVLGFVKVCLTFVPQEQLDAHLEELVSLLCRWNDGSMRGKTHTLMEMLVKRFEPERLARLVPEEHSNFFNKVRKGVVRRAKAKAEAWKERRERAQESHESRPAASAAAAAPANSQRARAAAASRAMRGRGGDESGGDESGSEAGWSTGEDDDDDDDVGVGQEAGKRGAGAAAAAAAGARRRRGEERGVWLMDEQVDLSDARALAQGLSASAPRRTVLKVRRPQTSKDGKLVFGFGDGAATTAPAAGSSGKPQAPRQRPVKRGRDDEDEGDEEERGGEEKRELAFGRRAQAARARPASRPQQSGPAAAAAAAAGARGGAAVHFLSPNMLNRRNRHRAARQVERIVSAAQRGSKAGAKAAKRARGHSIRVKQQHGKGGRGAAASAMADD
jgi:hypothetical protein